MTLSPPKGKFNRGVPTDMKKRTWAEITARVNEIGECQREVIEVIKKWSDLKCDTKRKVAAMRSGTVPNRGLNSRLSRDLNQTEKIVLQILEMDDEDQSTGDFGPLGDDDDVPEEEEEMEEEDMIGLQSSPNGGLDMASTSYSTSECFQETPFSLFTHLCFTLNISGVHKKVILNKSHLPLGLQ